jgi:putative nucleotidyltransferase with HDIG domain
VGGFFSLVVVLGLGPMLELIAPTTSRFRLMELMNLEQPLLQELMATVPGTYHHSFVVANMVEAGARSIDANALLCKVAALYHDIGKLSNPEYFIENQGRGKNKHDKLAPSMSALILIAHVKKGVELARKGRLGQDIVDIIRQHHGTSVIRFFYQKAREQAGDREAVREEEYRYPGPRPQTKEAAIVMLADAIEASSRTLSDPTPSRLRGHIDNIVKYIFSEGQLDESELTFKDLHSLSEAFHRVLTGIFHQRIEYPDTLAVRVDGHGRGQGRKGNGRKGEGQKAGARGDDANGGPSGGENGEAADLPGPAESVESVDSEPVQSPDPAIAPGMPEASGAPDASGERS